MKSSILTNVLLLFCVIERRIEHSYKLIVSSFESNLVFNLVHSRSIFTTR